MAYEKNFTDALQFIWGDGFLSPGGPEEIEVIFADTDIAGHRVLDIGSGLGGIDMLLVTRFQAGHVVGIDVEPDLVEQSIQLARRHGLSDQTEFHCVLPGALPFPDESFDSVFSKDAMVHVEDKLALYQEVRRVLRPGGIFRAGDWLWAKGAQTHPAVTAWLGGGPLHFAFTTPDAARDALHEAGLTKVEVTDRRSALQKSDSELISRLDGPDFELLKALVGEEEAVARRSAVHKRLAAIKQGQLISCHLKATRMPEVP